MVLLYVQYRVLASFVLEFFMFFCLCVWFSHGFSAHCFCPLYYFLSSCVVLGPPAGYRIARVFNVALCNHRLLGFRLVLLCRPSVDLSAGHRTGRTSKQQPCSLGTRSAPFAHVVVVIVVLISFRVNVPWIFSWYYVVASGTGGNSTPR